MKDWILVAVGLLIGQCAKMFRVGQRTPFMER